MNKQQISANRQDNLQYTVSFANDTTKLNTQSKYLPLIDICDILSTGASFGASAAWPTSNSTISLSSILSKSVSYQHCMIHEANEMLASNMFLQHLTHTIIRFSRVC